MVRALIAQRDHHLGNIDAYCPELGRCGWVEDRKGGAELPVQLSVSIACLRFAQRKEKGMYGSETGIERMNYFYSHREWDFGHLVWPTLVEYLGRMLWLFLSSCTYVTLHQSPRSNGDWNLLQTKSIQATWIDLVDKWENSSSKEAVMFPISYGYSSSWLGNFHPRYIRAW